MKLSVQTINVLKNFSGINRSIVFRPGTTLATMSSNKTIVAKATVPDEFTNTFGIYQLNEFIGALSLIDNPDLDFGDNFVTIRGDGDSEIVFHYAEISTIISPPEKDIKLPTVDVEVSLSNKDIQKVSKALNLFGLPELAIVGDGNQRRDFVYVGDICNANITAAFSDVDYEAYGQVYNVGTGNNVSVNQIARMVGGNTVNLAPRAGEVRISLANNQKIKKTFGWQPTVKLEDWIKENA